MKKLLAILLSLNLILISPLCFAKEKKLHSTVMTLKENVTMDLHSKSACLMEAETGEILYEQSANEKLEPASVTKIMTVLLIYEALSDGRINKTDIVTASKTASEMGGSQIWLEEGEQMTVDEMLKAILVVSANDCTVAMAEHLAGSEEAFVTLMNEKAKELSMENTNFKNSTGLPIEGHYTSAKDIALMTRELLKYEDVFNYTLIWMDSLRNGEFGLSNTNKLIRFYPGANGMKTGFTDSALYCMSATATRDGMTLISVVMKADTSDNRFSDAKKLLDYGFANFSVYRIDEQKLPPLKVKGGVADSVALKYTSSAILLTKGRDKLVESKITLPEYIKAPVDEGQVVGQISYSLCGEEIAVVDITTLNGIEKISFSQILKKLIGTAVMIR